MASMRLEQDWLLMRLEKRWPGEIILECDIDELDEGETIEYLVSVLVTNDVGVPKTVGYGDNKKKVTEVSASACALDDGRVYYVALGYDGQWGTSYKCSDYHQMVDMLEMFAEELRGEAEM